MYPSPTTLPASALIVNTSVMDIKKTWEKLPCLSHDLAFALPLTKISNSASPRRAVYKRPSPMALCEIFHFVQNDKFVQNDEARPRSHRLGVINARSGRFVAVSSGKSKLRSLIVEDNVQKTSFSCSSVRLVASTKSAVSGTCRARNPICLDPPNPWDWLSREQN